MGGSSPTKPCSHTCLQGQEAQPDFHLGLQPQDRSLSREHVAEGAGETHQAENTRGAGRQSPGVPWQCGGPRLSSPRPLSSLEMGSLVAQPGKGVRTAPDPNTRCKPQRRVPAKARDAGAPAPRGGSRTGGARRPPAPATAWGTPRPPPPSRAGAPPSRMRPHFAPGQDSYPSRRRLLHVCQSPLNSRTPPDTPRAVCGSPGRPRPLLDATARTVLTQGALWECGPPGTKTSSSRSSPARGIHIAPPCGRRVNSSAALRATGLRTAGGLRLGM